MNVGQLKRLLAHLPDSAIVMARDRDCCGLDCIHIIGSDNQPKHSIKEFGARVYFVDTPEEMYGGEILQEQGIKQAIVFCDNG